MDESLVRDYNQSASPEQLNPLRTDLERLISEDALPLNDFGSEANRWFADQDEGRAWLNRLNQILQNPSITGNADPSENLILVKDSNGTVLADGDAVQVIKDLKVKGGSSDLKKGTVLRKIRLIGDPENIEVKVDGSVLVLKTQFLKKS